MLQWAREHGCPWEFHRVCNDAADNGRLEVLVWAREQGCPWGEGNVPPRCAAAAEGGNLEVLKWARMHDCPWHEVTCL